MALVGAYVLGLVGVYSGFTLYLVRLEVAQAHERFQQTAQIVAAELDAYIESGRQRLVTVTKLPGLAYGLESIQEAKGEGYIPPWTTLHYLFFRIPVFTAGVFLLDRTGKVLWTEPPGLPWHGQTLTDVPVIAELYRRGESLISSGVPADRLLDRPHVIVAAPLQSNSGAVDGVLGGVIDLTAAEFTKALSATSTVDGRFVDVIDRDGFVLASTDAARRFQRHQTPARTGDGFMVASAALLSAPWQVVAGQPQDLGLASVRQLQGVLWALGAGLLVAAVAVGAPFIRGVVRSIRQLTNSAEVMARGDLSQPVTIDQRQDEIATLAHTFEQMRVELERSRQALEQRIEEREELIRLREEFLANASHELRTPLHIIIGYTEMLADQPLSEDGRQLLQRVREQSDHLLQLLTDFLNLSGLNAGKIVLQVSPVRIASVLSRLVPLAEQLRQGKRIEVAWDVPPTLPTIETDALRLEQVLTNLFTNAFKFTSRGQVAIRVRHNVPDAVVFEIADTGIGIPAHELPYIFDEFHQVDGSAHSAYGGVGLGLALVKKLTALLHGEVVASSQVDVGSTFTVTIPLRIGGEQPELAQAG